MKEELKSILDFWTKNTIDQSNGGFVAELNDGGKLSNADEKGAVLNARLLWNFSAAYNFCKEPTYLDLADSTYNN